MFVKCVISSAPSVWVSQVTVLLVPLGNTCSVEPVGTTAQELPSEESVSASVLQGSTNILTRSAKSVKANVKPVMEPPESALPANMNSIPKVGNVLKTVEKDSITSEECVSPAITLASTAKLFLPNAQNAQLVTSDHKDNV